MRKTVLKKFVAFCVVLTMVAASMLPVSTFAAEEVSEDVTRVDATAERSDDGIEPYAGVETLEIGYNDIGDFTFTDTNLTPVKTIAGTKVTFTIPFYKADSDKGIGPVKLTVKVKDLNGKVLAQGTKSEKAGVTGAVLTIKDLDLKTKNKKVQIWFDASSVGESNGKFRSITVSGFSATVK